MPILKLISTERRDTRLDATSSDGDNQQRHQRQHLIDGSRNVESSIELRNGRKRHHCHSDAIYDGQPENGVELSPVGIGQDATNERKEVT